VAAISLLRRSAAVTQVTARSPSGRRRGRLSIQYGSASVRCWPGER